MTDVRPHVVLYRGRNPPKRHDSIAARSFVSSPARPPTSPAARSPTSRKRLPVCRVRCRTADRVEAPRLRVSTNGSTLPIFSCLCHPRPPSRLFELRSTRPSVRPLTPACTPDRPPAHRSVRPLIDPSARSPTLRPLARPAACSPIAPFTVRSNSSLHRLC